MHASSIAQKALTILAALTLSACAVLPQQDPVQVTVAGIDSLPGEGLEIRLLVKLRVQNPNDQAIDYDGVYLKLDVQGKTLASGVSDERGSVPRFGEEIVSVPLTVSMLRLMLRGVGMLGDSAPGRLDYRLEGKLNGPLFGSTRFQAQGELNLPDAASP